MKYILLLALLLLSVFGYSQRYFNVEGCLLTKGQVFGGGPLASFGGVITKDGNHGIMLGGGTGLLTMNDGRLYFPFFLKRDI